MPPIFLREIMHCKFRISFFLCLLFTLLVLPISRAQIPINTDYAQFIQERIYSSLVYPPDAFVQGSEGVVTLKFTIGQDGYLKDIFVSESSGYASLDEGAVAAVKGASPYPLPEDYTGEDVELVVPLEYRLEVPENPQPFIPPQTMRAQEQEHAQNAETTEPVDEQTETAQETAAPPVKQESAIPKKIAAALSEPGQTKLDFKVVWPEELSNFIDLAIKNNKPSQVAKKEVDLAEFKVRESMRNLLPSLKLTGTATDGETYHVPYQEQEEKIEINQPIYYGGRLIDSVEHAKVNAEIARRNLDRMKYDIMHKAESAYYNLVASRTHWKYKEELRNEASLRQPA